MKSFRFYHDIDADTEQEARDQLIEDMETMPPLVDMFVEERESKKISIEELAKYLKVKDIDFDDIQNHFCEYDAWLCLHCRADVGNESKAMIHHLMTHTLEELKKTDDGDDFEEDEE